MRLIKFKWQAPRNNQKKLTVYIKNKVMVSSIDCTIQFRKTDGIVGKPIHLVLGMTRDRVTEIHREK